MIDLGRIIGAIRLVLALPFIVLGVLILGSHIIKFDGTYKAKLVPARSQKQPQEGLKAGGDFYGSQGKGSIFRFYGSTMGIAVDGIENLINPATLELLYQRQQTEGGTLDESFIHGSADPDADALEGKQAVADGGEDRDEGDIVRADGEPVREHFNQDSDDGIVLGKPEKHKDEDDYGDDLTDLVPVRGRFLANINAFRQAAPFAMMDGQGFQRSTHYARQSMMKHVKSNPWVQSIYSILLLLLGWYFGSKSGGGGGGGGSPIPLPDMAGQDVVGSALPMVDASAAFEFALAVVAVVV